MADPLPSELLVRDPLSDVTRKERKLLLGVSIIGIAFIKTGLFPTKISALGIECTQTNQRAMVVVFFLVVMYFLVAFLVYAVSDFIAWRLAYIAAMKNAYEQRRKAVEEKQRNVHYTIGSDRDPYEEAEAHIKNLMSRNYLFIRFTGPTAIVRALLEFLLPIGIGIYTAALLWFAKVPIGST